MDYCYFKSDNSKEKLKNTFFIDLDNIELSEDTIGINRKNFCEENKIYTRKSSATIRLNIDDINDEEYEKWRNNKINKFFESLKSKNISFIFEKLHEITLEIMGIYNINFQCYFGNILNQDKYGYDKTLDNYLLNNIKNIFLIKQEMGKKDDFIKQNKAVIKYANTLSNEEKHKRYKTNYTIKANNKKMKNELSNFGRKKKLFGNIECMWAQNIEKICRSNDKNNIKLYLSNSYIHIIKEYKQQFLENDGNISRKSKNMEEYLKDFLNRNMTINCNNKLN